jgi:hypothetical protein
MPVKEALSDVHKTDTVKLPKVLYGVAAQHVSDSSSRGRASPRGAHPVRFCPPDARSRPFGTG